MALYYPELGQARPDRLFWSRICLSHYSVYWRPERDAEARAAFARLRIRPRRIEHQDEAQLVPGAKARFHAFLTYRAHHKLMNTDLTACEQLLD